ncbi:TadE/TadG family type IV pilus assembly protein [Pseudorhodoplanes sinuspersici]|nr:TadE/TadG family type IV pilus assembly protein [Pseudorhodoplanes sinuspersici]RKE69606.1 Flp pilus assembly protein TadG [Pseudorhodoplanes sinuspersici]
MHSLVFSLQQSVRRRLSRFAQDKRGVSAVEFALILPLMVLLYFGLVEVSQGVIVDRKVKMTARTVADLVSQVSTIDNSGVDAALGASTAILAPFSAANAKVIVSVVSIDNNGNAKIVWSRANKDSGHGTGDSVTVPDALKTPNTSLVWGEATYDYSPAMGYVTGPLTLSQQIFMRPRLSETVKKT